MAVLRTRATWYATRVRSDERGQADVMLAGELFPDVPIRHSPDDRGFEGKIAVFPRSAKPEARYLLPLACARLENATQAQLGRRFSAIWTHVSLCLGALIGSFAQAGAGRGRKPSINARISPNNRLGTATSAIWNVT